LTAIFVPSPELKALRVTLVRAREDARLDRMRGGTGWGFILRHDRRMPTTCWE